MKNLRIVLILIVLGSISCADFFKSGVQNSGKNRGKLTESGPFPPGFNPNEGKFSEAKMLANIGLHVIAPLTKDFRLQTELLEMEVQEVCSKPQNDNPEWSETGSIKKLWSRAALTYHKLDTVGVGPLSDDKRELALNIYGWPSFFACGIDLEVANPKSEALTYTIKGLGALEYLFFDDSLGTECNASNPRHQPAFEWIQKTVAQKRQDRCQMAQRVASDLALQARKLEKAWDPNDGNYTKTLWRGRAHGSQKEAVNALTNSLFSMEDLKDLRVGRPLGFIGCSRPDGKCPSQIEHLWSHLSIPAIIARLQMFRAVFTGSNLLNDSKFGLEEYLATSRHQDLANRMLSAIDQAIVSAQNFEKHGTLLEQVENMDANECRPPDARDSTVPGCLFYKHLAEVTTLLKRDFLIALSLKAPPTHQGDND